MTLQDQIQKNCKPLQIRIIKHDLIIFDEVGGITFKAVPVSESDGTLWLCRTQNTSAEVLQKYGEITAPKICEIINTLFPTK